MFVVDTNVLIYAINEECAEHERCRELLSRWRREPLPWNLTWGIVYEFLRVSTHPRVFAQPLDIRQAWAFIEALRAAPGLGFLVPGERHAEVAAWTFTEVPELRGNLLHDTHTAVLMREHGIRRIYTRDMDFHRFSFLDVLDPLADAD